MIMCKTIECNNNTNTTITWIMPYSTSTVTHHAATIVNTFDK